MKKKKIDIQRETNDNKFKKSNTKIYVIYI